MKVVINTCVGGLTLSEKAYKYLGLKWDGYGFANEEYAPIYTKEENGDYPYDVPLDYSARTDSELVKCVLELGKEADGRFSKLAVLDLPDDIKAWTIVHSYGSEVIVEITGRVWPRLEAYI